MIKHRDEIHDYITGREGALSLPAQTEGRAATQGQLSAETINQVKEQLDDYIPWEYIEFNGMKLRAKGDDNVQIFDDGDWHDVEGCGVSRDFALTSWMYFKQRSAAM